MVVTSVLGVYGWKHFQARRGLGVSEKSTFGVTTAQLAEAQSSPPVVAIPDRSPPVEPEIAPPPQIGERALAVLRACEVDANAEAVVNILRSADKELIEQLLPFEGQIATPDIARAMSRDLWNVSSAAEELFFRAVGRNASADEVQEALNRVANQELSDADRFKALRFISFTTSPDGEGPLLMALQNYHNVLLADAIGQAFALAPSTTSLERLVDVLAAIRLDAPDVAQAVASKIDPVSALLTEEKLAFFKSAFPSPVDEEMVKP